MSKSHNRTPRKPATKFAHLQKKLRQTQVRTKQSRKK